MCAGLCPPKSGQRAAVGTSAAYEKKPLMGASAMYASPQNTGVCVCVRRALGLLSVSSHQINKTQSACGEGEGRRGEGKH